MSPLETRMWKTVAWFSLFETPVTVFEMWRWMLDPAPREGRGYGLDEVYAALEGEGLRGKLVGKDGFWTLRDATKVAGNSEFKATLVAARRERFLDAIRKYGKLRRATRYLSLVPGVVGVAAGNTLAWWNTRPDSDIDLFIVTKPGWIWTSRLLCVLPFALLGKRPGASSVDPFCFSFFATEDALDLSSVRLEGGDPYLDYWIRSIVPVHEREGVFEKFCAANSTSPNPSLPAGRQGLLRRGNATGSLPLTKGEVRRGWMRFVESAARRFQLRRLPRRIREMMNADSRVVVTDSMLKFHDQDRRAEFHDALMNLCRETA